MKLKKINEDHYVLEHDDGSTFKVAKKALNKTAQAKIESMANKYADGGVVPVDINYKPAPDFIPDADFKPDYGDKPKFAGVTKATRQEQEMAAPIAPGAGEKYKVAADQLFPEKRPVSANYQLEQRPGGAEEAMISPLDFPVEAASLASAGAKGLVKGARVAGRELVEAFPRVMASEVGTAGAQAVKPRINPLGMYSKLEQTIAEKMGGSATPEQIVGMLRDVKPEEMQYSGLNDFLAGKNKVSKQELLEFVKSNELPVQEIVRGSKAAQLEVDLRKSLIEKGYTGQLLEDIMSRARRSGGLNDIIPDSLRQQAEDMFVARRLSDETKYSEYTLPGGENYREKLYTLPKSKPLEKPQKLIDVENKLDAINDSGEITFPSSPESREKALNERDILQKEWQELNSEYLSEYNKNKKDPYLSSHFNEPNILAHTRLNDRVDAEGRKHLFAEEIQSDWHQAGRERGYKNPKSSQEKSDIESKIHIETKKLFPNNDKLAKSFAENVIRETNNGYVALTPEAPKELQELTFRLRDIGKKNVNTVPDAPMKKTWHEFVSKNLLSDAAKGGYDNVSWTTGAQQADRYALSKNVNNIQYNPSSKTLFAEGKNGSTAIDKSGVSTEDLPGIIGKDAAKKLLDESSVISRKNDGTPYLHELSGVNLDVGGEGMKGFYDKIIPDYMGKLGKKYGVKPELVDIPTPTSRSLRGTKSAEKFPEKQKVWTMKITPEMRKDIIEKGLPLYSVGGVVAGGMLNSKEAEAKNMNYKLLKNEQDHYVMKHPDGSQFKVAKKGLKSDIANKIESMAKGYYDGGPVSSMDDQEPVASTMPQAAEPDFQQMVKENPITPQESINKEIAQAKQDLTGRLGAMYAKSGIPSSYDEARLQKEAEEKVLADKESQDLARRNESFLFNQEQDKQVAEAQAYNERASKYGLPLRTVPGQASTLAEATQPQAQDQTQAATVAGEVKAKKPEADIFGQMETAYRTSAKAEQDLDALKEQKYAQAKLDLEAANKAYDERVQKYTSEANRLQKQIEQNPVDSNKYYKNLTTGGKISAAIGLMVAGIGAGITKTENAALKVINNAIENDILAQKQNMDQANNLYRENLNRVKDEGVAYNLTKAEFLGKVELDIKAAASKADSAQQKASLLKNLAEVQMARNAYLQKSALTDVLKLAQTNPQMITPEIAQMLPEEQRARIVPGAGFTYTKEGAQKVREIKANRDDIVGLIDTLENIRKQSGRELTPSQASAKAQAIGQALIGKFREPVLGPGAMTEGEYDRLTKVIPKDVTAVATLDNNVFAQLQVAKDLVNNSYVNRARAEGINFPTSQAQAQQGQIQTRQGIPYQKVPGGWVPLKTGR